MRIYQLAAILALPACTAADSRPLDVARMTCPPPDVFSHAICACNDLDQVGELYVNGAGSIGVNGYTAFVSEAHIAGSLYAYGGLSSVGIGIGDTLVTPSDVSIVGDATIHDATIGGDLSAVGTLAIPGSLRLHGDRNIVGESAIATEGAYETAGAAPCGCDPATLFDPATAVAAARQGTGGAEAWDYVGDTTVHLATGSYYITSSAVVGTTQIVIDGNVSLFVDGDLDAVGSTQWQLAPGASLDLFVSGDVSQVGDVTAGDPARAGDFRLFVGGSSTATVGTATFAGSLYAPHADVSYVGDAHIIGSIFASSISGVGTLTIDYGEPLSTPQSCQQPPGGGGSGSGSGEIL